MKKYLLLSCLLCWSLFGQPTLYLIGDSTMANKKNPLENPEWGWGQALPFYMKNSIKIENHAVNGRSSRSFIDEGRWDVIEKQLEKGDFVFIQFGHNDQKDQDPSRYTNPSTTYRQNLIRFVSETRAKGATPILFTSVVRRNFNANGTLVDTHGLYPVIVHQVAQKQNIALVDMQSLSEHIELLYGLEASKKLHLHFEKGEHPYFPEGKKDNTHFSEWGARVMAQAVVKNLDQQGLLVPHLNLTEVLTTP